MKRFAIIYGMITLACALFKALFYRNTLIYRCPTCSLVMWKGTPECQRCETLIDWVKI